MPEPRPEPSNRGADTPGASRTALVVDDVASVRFFHSFVLGKLGFHCVAAENGDEAVAQMRQHRFALVILDLTMPGTDGRAFIREVRSHPESAGVPILVISSLPDAADLRRPRTDEAGPIGFAQKPLMPSSIVTEVHRLLDT